MIKMLQYKMYPAGELAVLRQLLFMQSNKTYPDFSPKLNLIGVSVKNLKCIFVESSIITHACNEDRTVADLESVREFQLTPLRVQIVSFS